MVAFSQLKKFLRISLFASFHQNVYIVLKMWVVIKVGNNKNKLYLSGIFAACATAGLIGGNNAGNGWGTTGTPNGSASGGDTGKGNGFAGGTRGTAAGKGNGRGPIGTGGASGNGRGVRTEGSGNGPKGTGGTMGENGLAIGTGAWAVGMKGLSNGNGKRGPQHMHFIVGHGRLEEEHPLAGEASSSGEVITGASLFCKKS